MKNKAWMDLKKMNVLHEIENLSQPELGKFGEFLAEKYWIENQLDVKSSHHNQVDFYVNRIPYDVKTKATSLRKGRKYDNKPPVFHGQCKEGVRIFIVAIYTDCAIFASDFKCLKRLDLDQLKERWCELSSQKRSVRELAAPRSEFDTWFNQQKEHVKEICDSHKLRVRVLYRNGVEVQRKFGKWGPNSLIPPDPSKEKLTVFLWTEGESIYRVIAFLHSDIQRMPLHEYTPPNKAAHLTMPLENFEKFRGKWCFDSISDFENNFRFE